MSSRGVGDGVVLCLVHPRLRLMSTASRLFCGWKANS